MAGSLPNRLKTLLGRQYAEKRENIRFRIFLPMVLAGITLLAVLIISVRLKTDRDISSAVDREITGLNDTFQLVLEQDAGFLDSVLDTVTYSPAMTDLFLAGKRETLYEWVKPRFENLRLNHKITHLYFFDADRRCFLRVHSPERFGDVVNHKTLLEVERTGKPAFGLELGPLGTLTLRAVIPWHRDGKLLGYLEAGEEIEPIAERLAGMLKLDLFILLRKKFLDQEGWERGMKMLGREGAWEQFPSWVRIYPATKDIPGALSEVLSGADDGFSAHRFCIVRDRRHYEVAIEPFLDVESREIGGRVLLFDVTGAVTESRNLVMLVGTVVLVIGGLLFVLLLAYFGHVEKQLSEARRRALEESQAREEAQRRHLDDLQRAREELEERVLERTEELTNANDLLHEEVAERRHVESLIRQSEEKYRTLFEEAKDAIVISTPQGRILDANPAGVELFGYSSKDEFLQVSIHDLFVNPGDGENFQAMMKKQGFVKNFERRFKTKDGSEIQVVESATAVLDERGEIAAYRRTMRDITELKRYEKQLIQAQKMESIGTLAGGLAHDFNNILSGILGYASLMKQKITSENPFFSYVDTIEKGTIRAAELTAQLLAFSRGGKFEIRPTDLNKVVLETQKLVTRTFDKAIQIQVNLGEPLPTVEGDPGQLQQVLMNLCVNARDAMPAGGILSIMTSVEEVGEEYIQKYSYAMPGFYDVISVSDSGAGMDRDTREKIFEPFFSTKEQGKGTGLGLAVVYGIVKNHSGWVNVYSEPGFGSIFKVYLPASDKSLVEIPVEQTLLCLGNEVVLVVDDEETVRIMVKEILENFNYRVLLAHNGTQALKMYAELKDEIDLVLLDMIMPVMGGEETFQKLKSINPEVKVLLSTGYAQDGKAQAIIDSGARGFVQKPYKIEELLRAISTVLKAGKPG